ncbi:MAG: WYL domain-containing protein [bacterium]
MKKRTPLGFDAPIKYDKTRKGYVYGEQGFSIADLNLEDIEWEALDFAAKLLYQYKEVPIFANFKSAIERINSRFSLGFDASEAIIYEMVQFERPVDTKGYEWIQIIYEAIQNKFGVSITYHNIYKKEVKKYQLVPYLLKEYRNRWYLIGWSIEKSKYLTFGLDRIKELDMIEIMQQFKFDFNAQDMFQFTTGIMENNNQPTPIILRIKNPISELVLLEPIHQSQKLINQTNEEITIQLEVMVNEEFYLRLLGYGHYCTVLKPASLRKKIKGLVESMLTNYQ